MPDDSASMVIEQIEPRGGWRPEVLRAIEAVPRHVFVPEALRSEAYADHPLPIGEGQTISQPFIVARMTELSGAVPGSRVLEVGTGSGYQAAVLAALGARVWTVEIRPALAAVARRALERAGLLDRIVMRTGDGWGGWPEEAPFDAVVVTAAAPRVPPALVAQLAPGGRLVLPVGSWWQELQRWTRRGDRCAVEHLDPVSFVPMARTRHRQ